MSCSQHYFYVLNLLLDSVVAYLIIFNLKVVVKMMSRLFQQMCSLVAGVMLSLTFAQYSYAESSVVESKIKSTHAAVKDSKKDIKTKTTKTVLKPRVELKTSLGDIVIELYPDKAPITVANFLKYVDDGYYNGTIFHRVIDNFMAQAGGFTFDFQQKTTRGSIKNESGNGLKNIEGSLAMARLSAPDSAAAQFFINLRANPHLDARGARLGYAVFGSVVEGFDVVKKIEAQARGMHGRFPDAPNAAVIIENASRKK